MEITQLSPRGFCIGVARAWMGISQILKMYPNRTIYMLGWLVHNKTIIDELTMQGVVILDDKGSTRLDLIKSIDLSLDPIVILSAHGTDHNVIDFLNQNKIEFVDLTCDYVYIVHHIIKVAIEDNKQVIFIGKKDHQELKAISCISDQIWIVSSKEDIKELPSTNKNIYITNQTTLSQFDYGELKELIVNKYKNTNKIEIKCDICQATFDRQNAIINMPDDIELLIVCGDIRSSNANSLCEIGNKLKKIPTYLVNKKEDIDLNWFNNINKIAITSSASTPNYVYNEILNYLEGIKK